MAVKTMFEFEIGSTVEANRERLGEDYSYKGLEKETAI